MFLVNLKRLGTNKNTVQENLDPSVGNYWQPTVIVDNVAVRCHFSVIF